MSPNPSPRAAHDEDIIELTELVEKGTVGASDEAEFSLDEAVVDMSFEKELEDLFSEAPGVKAAPPAKPAPPAPALVEDDAADLLDGFDSGDPGSDELDLDAALREIQSDDFPKAAASIRPKSVGSDELADLEDDDLYLDLGLKDTNASSQAHATESEDDLDLAELDALLSEGRPSQPPAPKGAPAPQAARPKADSGPERMDFDALDSLLDEVHSAPSKAKTADDLDDIDISGLDELIDTLELPDSGARSAPAAQAQIQPVQPMDQDLFPDEPTAAPAALDMPNLDLLEEFSGFDETVTMDVKAETPATIARAQTPGGPMEIEFEAEELPSLTQPETPTAESRAPSDLDLAYVFDDPALAVPKAEPLRVSDPAEDFDFQAREIESDEEPKIKAGAELGDFGLAAAALAAAAGAAALASTAAPAPAPAAAEIDIDPEPTATFDQKEIEAALNESNLAAPTYTHALYEKIRLIEEEFQALKASLPQTGPDLSAFEERIESALAGLDARIEASVERALAARTPQSAPLAASVSPDAQSEERLAALEQNLSSGLSELSAEFKADLVLQEERAASIDERLDAALFNLDSRFEEGMAGIEARIEKVLDRKAVESGKQRGPLVELEERLGKAVAALDADFHETLSGLGGRIDAALQKHVAGLRLEDNLRSIAASRIEQVLAPHSAFMVELRETLASLVDKAVRDALKSLEDKYLTHKEWNRFALEFKEDIKAMVERIVPLAAARVLREEISALAEDLA